MAMQRLGDKVLLMVHAAAKAGGDAATALAIAYELIKDDNDMEKLTVIRLAKAVRDEMAAATSAATSLGGW